MFIEFLILINGNISNSHTIEINSAIFDSTNLEIRGSSDLLGSEATNPKYSSFVNNRKSDPTGKVILSSSKASSRFIA